MRLLQTNLPTISRIVRSEQVLILVAAALVGVAGAYGAILFRWMILGGQFVFFGPRGESLDHLREIAWYHRLLAPALGGLAISIIVVRWSPESRGSGIPEVIESVALRGGAVRKLVAPLKALAAAICIGSGGSAGREGPIVHIGAAIGSWIAQTLRLSVKQMRTLVGCGAAAGIAATFNTPFAGALFAVEVVLGDFGAVKFSPIVIASVVATVVSRHYTSEFPQIEVPPFEEPGSVLAVFPYLVLGVACALVSVAFIRSLKLGWKLGDRWPYSPYLLPAFGGLVVGTIGVALPEVFGVGYDTINDVLKGNVELSLVIAILIAKTVATSATLTSGGSGGIFAPSLFLGALTGYLTGMVLGRVFPGLEISPEAYALIGMGAVVAGTTRAPISAVLIIFELTREESVILPLMAACIPAVLISARLHRDSIYIAKLTHKGVSLKSKAELNLLKGQTAADVMQSRVESVTPDTSLTDLLERFMESRFPVMWAADDEGRLAGVLESQNLRLAMLERDSLMQLIVAQDIASPARSVVHPDDDLAVVMGLLADAPNEVLPVVDRRTNVIRGDVVRSDIIEAYQRELAIRDSVTTAVDAITVAERLGQVDLGDGYALVEFEVPAHLDGKTLAELDLRRRFDLQVLHIKRGKERLFAGPSTVVKTGDVFLVTGETKTLAHKLHAL